MSEDPSKLLSAIASEVERMDREAVVSSVTSALENGIPPLEIIQSGLSVGMNQVGKNYAEGKCFVPEVLLASKALYAGLDIVQPHLPEGDEDHSIKVLIGVVAGDVHDIGKNIVKLMLSTSGFKVIDLGKNVRIEQFKEAIEEHQPDVLAISTLMSSTIITMRRTIAAIREAALDQNLTIIIGGAPLHEDHVDDVGADLYGADADDAIRVLSERFGLQRSLS